MLKKIRYTLIVLVAAFVVVAVIFSRESNDRIALPEIEVKENASKNEKQSDIIKKDLELEKAIAYENQNKKEVKATETKLDMSDLFRKEPVNVSEADKGKKGSTVEATKVETRTSEPKRSSDASKTVAKEYKKPVEKVTQKDPEESKDPVLANEVTGAPKIGNRFSTRKEPVEVKKPVEKKGVATDTPVSAEYRVASITIYGDYKLVQNSKVEFFLEEDIEVNGKVIKANTVFEGFVQSINQRILFNVSHVNRIFSTYQVLDEDLKPGIYNSAFRLESPSDVTRETSGEIGDEIIKSTGVTEIDLLKNVVRGGKKIVERNTRYDVFLENGRKMYLKY